MHDPLLRFYPEPPRPPDPPDLLTARRALSRASAALEWLSPALEVIARTPAGCSYGARLDDLRYALATLDVVLPDAEEEI